MSDHDETEHELVSRLRVIEAQPLAARAAAYAGLHEELTRRLDAGPGPGAAEG